MKRHEAIAIADRLFAAARMRFRAASAVETSRAYGYLEAAEMYRDLLRLSDSSASLDPMYERRLHAVEDHVRDMESRA